ncbi:MAG: hypothetical protein ABIO70_04030 [Pseudomonadota bacterium]
MSWQDHPASPLIRPRWWSWIAGDPSVLTPAETPDGAWRLVCNNVQGIYQYRSDDGLCWELVQRVDPLGFRPWILAHDGAFWLCYQRFHRLFSRSVLVARHSTDLLRWSPAAVVLRPELAWEGAHVSNPCVLPAPEGGFWLYYAADQVFLEDMGFWEPAAVSRAWGPTPAGPWEKHGSPVLGPEPGHRFRDRGAGALKVYAGLLDGYYAGFQNGIFRDTAGRSGSAVLLLRSRDGLTWEEHPDNPIIAPGSEAPRWRRAQVYQLDVAPVGEALWMFVNGRDGWRFGVERVGLCVLPRLGELWGLSSGKSP